MNTDPFDRNMIHVFLREEVGGQNPPDMSREILARALGANAVASPPGRPTRLVIRRWWEVPAAVAATILIGFIIWAATLSRYPQPEASGHYSLVSGDKVARGATIRTKGSTASLALGGYCRVDIRPWTTLRIGGRNGAEAVFVEKGTVVCSVDSGVGTFVVSTELGAVSVTGTEFTVHVAADGEHKKMRVRVTTGSVEVSDGWDSETLAAGQERTLGQGSTARSEPVGRDADTEPSGRVDRAGSEDAEGPGMTSEADTEAVLAERIRVLQVRIEEAVERIGELRQQSTELQEALDAKRREGAEP